MQGDPMEGFQEGGDKSLKIIGSDLIIVNELDITIKPENYLINIGNLTFPMFMPISMN